MKSEIERVVNAYSLLVRTDHNINYERGLAYLALIEFFADHKTTNGDQMVRDRDIVSWSSVSSTWLATIRRNLFEGILFVDAWHTFARWVNAFNTQYERSMYLSSYDLKRVTQAISGSCIKFQIPEGFYLPSSDEEHHHFKSDDFGYAIIKRNHISNSTNNAAFYIPRRNGVFGFDQQPVVESSTGFWLPCDIVANAVLEDGRIFTYGRPLLHSAYIPFGWMTTTCGQNIQVSGTWRELAERIITARTEK